MAVSNQRISQSYTVTRDIKSVETKMLKLVLAIETYRMPMQNWCWIRRCSQIKIELLAAVLAVFPNTNAFFSQSLARLRKRACVKHSLPSTKKAKDSYMTASKISQPYYQTSTSQKESNHLILRQTSGSPTHQVALAVAKMLQNVRLSG